MLADSGVATQGGKAKKRVRRSKVKGRFLTPEDCKDEQTSGLQDYNERRQEYLRYILNSEDSDHGEATHPARLVVTSGLWQKEPLVVKPEDPDYYYQSLGDQDDQDTGGEEVHNGVGEDELDVRLLCVLTGYPRRSCKVLNVLLPFSHYTAI